MYPRDAITLFFDNPANNLVLLASTSTPRTFLAAKMVCDVVSDTHLRFGTGGSVYLLDKEVGVYETTSEVQYSTTTSLVYTESIAAHCSGYVVYLERDRGVVKDPELSTTTQATSTTGTTSLIVSQQINTIDFIYIILLTVGVLTYIFKK